VLLSVIRSKDNLKNRLDVIILSLNNLRITKFYISVLKISILQEIFTEIFSLSYFLLLENTINYACVLCWDQYFSIRNSITVKSFRQYEDFYILDYMICK